MNAIKLIICFLSITVIQSCSDEKIIGLKQTIHHDDFEYSVQSVDLAKYINSKYPKGVFYIVTFKVENNAKRVDHEWDNNIAYLIDENKTVYENSTELQKECREIIPFNYQDNYVTPAGKSQITKLIFDVPKEVKLYLQVRGEFLMGDLFDGNQFKKTKIKLF